MIIYIAQSFDDFSMGFGGLYFQGGRSGVGPGGREGNGFGIFDAGSLLIVPKSGDFGYVSKDYTLALGFAAKLATVGETQVMQFGVMRIFLDDNNYISSTQYVNGLTITQNSIGGFAGTFPDGKSFITKYPLYERGSWCYIECMFDCFWIPPVPAGPGGVPPAKPSEWHLHCDGIRFNDILMSFGNGGLQGDVATVIYGVGFLVVADPKIIEAACLGIVHVPLDASISAFDDLYIADEFLGDIGVGTFLPISDGDDLNWIPSTPGPHYRMVDDAAGEDEDGTYVGTSNIDVDFNTTYSGAVDLYRFDISLNVGPNSVILGVGHNQWARAGDAPIAVSWPFSSVCKPTSVAYLQQVSAGAFPTNFSDPTKKYSPFQWSWDVNPDTGLPWTIVDLANAQFGPYAGDVPVVIGTGSDPVVLPGA